jgi:hypothetical protein
MNDTPLPPHVRRTMARPRQPLSGLDLQTVVLIRGTAEELWDVAETISSTCYATADDWETARLTASHLLAALERRETPHHNG